MTSIFSLCFFIFITESFFCFLFLLLRRTMCSQNYFSPRSLRSQQRRLLSYFLDSLLITTTSRTTTSTPTTVQTHIPPPDHPPIHPSVWFIIKSLWLRCDPPAKGN